MILNRANKHKKKEIKNSNEEEEENEEEQEENEEEEEEVEEKEIKKAKKHSKNKNNIKKQKRKKEKKEIEVVAEKEDSDEEEENEDEDSDEKMKSRLRREKKFNIPKEKIFAIIIASLIIIILIMIIILLLGNNKNTTEEKNNISLAQPNNPNGSSSNNNNNNNNSPSADNNQDKPNNGEENKENQQPEEKKEGNIDIHNANREMKENYEKDGLLNVNKFWQENILKQEYKIEELIHKPNQIHINIGFNDNNINTYIKHIASILHKAEQERTFLHIHMMDSGELNFDTIKKLSKMIHNINNSTEIIVYNANSALKDFNIKADSVDKFATDYAKLYAFKILKDIQKIIFLDADDIMVQRDLGELYDLKMDNIYARGIAEEPEIKGPMEWYDKYILDKSHYINGGVMLINLELSQRDNLYTKATELNNDEFYMKTENPMQDILNVLMRKKIEFFHPKFNKINFYENPIDRENENKWYENMQQTLKLGEKNNHFYTKEELLEADENPVIIHYYWDKALEKIIVKYEEDKKEYSKLCELNE